MRLLLDTHVFLWYVSGDERLSEDLREAIRDPANEVFLSVASSWEAVIKHSLGKLPLPAPAADFLPKEREAHRIASLTVEEGVLTHLAGLPPLHRDPFDRLLVAQALHHQLTFVSLDEAVRAYEVPCCPPGRKSGRRNHDAARSFRRPRSARWRVDPPAIGVEVVTMAL